MSRQRVLYGDRTITIGRWLGVNESADGDAHLAMGEASTMTNFRITNDGSLQKRPGTKNVASLLYAYTLTVGTSTTLLMETNASTASYEMKVGINVGDGGLPYLTGDAVTANLTNHSSYTDYYYQSPAGECYKFIDATYETHSDATHVTGGWVTVGTSTTLFTSNSIPAVYSNIAVSGGSVSLSSASSSPYIGKYIYKSGVIHRVDSSEVITDYIPEYGEFTYTQYYGPPITYHANDVWTWDFRPMTVVANTSDSPVRGLWSGNVAGTERIIAACNGTLWSLSETGGVWTKASIGSITTTSKVHFFGFNGKVYMMNGSQYKSWNGTSLVDVAGYRPLIAVAAPYGGGGTSLQRINMLNGLRRIQFSPDGSHATFQLPETALTSIDYVKNMTTGTNYTLTTDYTVDATNGTVTMTSTPTAGTNTLEIGYTFPTTFRTTILAARLSELFNGANDNRVFVYGDGTNKAYYSDLEYETGLATAEYFPDLNVISFGDSNTPITSMARHYDRLLVFKKDAAYSVRYDTLTLVTGTATAGFYISTLNKDVGCTGYGQALVVGNAPRTLDGRSLYEWIATTTSGNIAPDQRNAQRISQKIEITLRAMDLDAAITFYDKIGHEYYIVENGTAAVQNFHNGAWYIYRDFPAVCMIVYNDELYFGTATGDLRHVSRNYRSDCDTAISCYWESGSMDFGADYMLKYSDSIWVVLKPEDDASVTVTIQTDKMSDYQDETLIADYTSQVATGFFDFLNLTFPHFSFNVNDKPQTQRRKIRVRNFAWYKLIFSSASAETTATVLNADIRVRYSRTVK